MKRFLCCIAALGLALSFAIAGCAPEEEEPYVEDPEPTVPATGKYIAQDGASDYKIVIPQNAQEKELLARDEIVEFFFRSTGITLESTSDFGLNYDPQAKYLSVGATTILEGSNITVSADALTKQGYKVVTRGNTVIMAGPTDVASLYAAYAFMKYTIGFEAYALDEVEVDKLDEVELLQFDLTDVPAFEQRHVSYYSAIQSELYRDRLRLGVHGEDWIFATHSHFTIMPPATYRTAHPDWYSPDGSQLCLTNEEMRQEFVRNVKMYITNHPDDHYILLGEEDRNSFCNCDNCKKALETYKKPSGVDMVFVNKVARDINDWLRSTDPDREIYIGTFAYLATFDPPVEFDEAKGEYVPVSPDVVAEDNVFVFLAPLNANYNYGFMDEENDFYRDGMNGWKAVTKTFCIWTYSANYLNYFVNFNNWSTQAKQYGELQSLGSKSVIDLGAYETGSVTFEALRLYLISRLMWDNTLNVDKLVNDFITNYYKDAAPYMRSYYDLMRTYSEYLRAEFGIDATCYVNMRQKQYWTRGYLDQCEDLFAQGIAAVEKYRETDPTLYEKLVNRIKLEKLSVDFFLIDFYQSTFTVAEQTAMIDEFESVARFNHVIHWHEASNLTQGDDGSIDVVIAGWRRNIG